jgi:hypothetical protein
MIAALASLGSASGEPLPAMLSRLAESAAMQLSVVDHYLHHGGQPACHAGHRHATLSFSSYHAFGVDIRGWSTPANYAFELFI